MYYINFTEQHKKFCLALCYNSVNSVKIFKFKAKNSEINAARLCLGKVSKYFSVDNMEKTELYEMSKIFV